MSGRARSSWRWAGPLVVGCGLVVAFYALPYIAHLDLPAGDDGTFYVGAIRDAGGIGLVDPQVAARPAYPVVGAMLSSVSGTSPWTVAAGLPIALVAALGLAGAGVAVRWRRDGAWVTVFAVLTALSAVAARLVAGKDENLMILALIAAMLAILLWSEGLDQWIGIGVVALAAGLTEWPLMLGFLGILAVDAVILAVRRNGEGLVEILPLVSAAVAGFAVALLLALLGSDATLRIQHLPGASRYGPRLDLELHLMSAWLTAGLAILGWWTARRLRHRAVESVRRVLTVWLVLTAVATAAGVLGAAFPSYRVLTFGLPLMLASAAAAFVVTGRPAGLFSAGRLGRPVLGIAIAVASVFPAADLWFRGLPPSVTADQVRELDAAGRYAAALPDGQPAVVVVRLKAEKFLVYQRVVHDVLPVGAGNRLLVFIGNVEDALAGRPSKAFSPGGQAVVDRLFPPIGEALSAGAPILTGRALNAHGFDAAEAGATGRLGEDVVVVRGPPPESSAASTLAVPVEPGPVAVFAIFALLVLFAAGIGWSLLLVPRAPPVVAVALAPGIGLAAGSVLVFLATRIGIHPRGAGAVVELIALLALSAGAGRAWVRHRYPGRHRSEVAVGTDAGATATATAPAEAEIPAKATATTPAEAEIPAKATAETPDDAEADAETAPGPGSSVDGGGPEAGA